jgi:glycosyltransferase involved in cell wall biosynthesis
MKIIQLITELYPAGAEKVVLNLSIELKKHGHDISVISLQPLPKINTDIVDDLLQANITVQSLNLTKFTPWRIFKLIKVLKKEFKLKPATDTQQHIVHSHLIHANIISRLCKIFNKNFRLVNTVHIAEKRKSKWWHFLLDKITFRLCDTQTAVSKAAQLHHARQIGVSPEEIPVIYNGIVQPKQLSEEEIKHLLQEWGFKKYSKIIGSVGRLDWQKGYDIFLKILPELSKAIPKGETWGIVILGEGSQRLYLQELIDKANFVNLKIILPGYRKDAADCISAFDLFIMPSRYEGFGLTLVEAMAHGVPCLCSNEDSLPNLIKNYPNGESIDFESEKIIDKMATYLNLKKQKPYFLFTAENMANNYLNLTY